MVKICPFTRGNKFGSAPCKRAECEWWLTDDKTCVIPKIAMSLREIITGKSKEIEQLKAELIDCVCNGDLD